MNLEGIRDTWQTHIICSEQATADKKLRRELEAQTQERVFSATSKTELILSIVGRINSRLIPDNTIVSNPVQLGHLGFYDSQGRSYGFASVAKLMKSEYSTHGFPVDGLSVYFYAGKFGGESLEIFDISKWTPAQNQATNSIEQLDERLDYLLTVIEDMPTLNESS